MGTIFQSQILLVAKKENKVSMFFEFWEKFEIVMQGGAILGFCEHF